MINCAECSHHIFCESFGEYKCEIKQQRVYKSPKTCENFEKIKAGEKTKTCHCLACQAYGYSEEE